MSSATEANKDVCRGFFAAIDAQDKQKASSFLHPKYRMSYPGMETPIDWDGHWTRTAGIASGFSDLRHVPDVIVAEDNVVFVRGTVTGTNDRPMFGQEPSGHAVDAQFMAVLRIEDQKIHELFSIMDLARISAQIGFDQTRI
ncbi:ester cyclase [Nonomuraea jabiensis]|uniref:ester cyclase n=1 Tax=Nonomuraea jabiensis TaxID=882448 RepID=UPI00343D9B29